MEDRVQRHERLTGVIVEMGSREVVKILNLVLLTHACTRHLNRECVGALPLLCPGSDATVRSGTRVSAVTGLQTHVTQLQTRVWTKRCVNFKDAWTNFDACVHRLPMGTFPKTNGFHKPATNSKPWKLSLTIPWRSWNFYPSVCFSPWLGGKTSKPRDSCSYRAFKEKKSFQSAESQCVIQRTSCVHTQPRWDAVCSWWSHSYYFKLCLAGEVIDKPKQHGIRRTAPPGTTRIGTRMNPVTTPTLRMKTAWSSGMFLDAVKKAGMICPAVQGLRSV